jgi:hypothetical protein
MRQFLIVVLLCCWAGMAVAAEGVFVKNGVSVVLSLERSGSSSESSSESPSEATIVGIFTPDPQHPQPLHLYGLSLPLGGPGIATRIALPADSPLRVRGPLTADQTTHELAGLPVFPEGPVTLRLPVHLPKGDGAPLAITVLIDYLACTHDSCLIPVIRGKVAMTVPTVAGVGVALPTAEAPKAALSGEEVRAIIADELARQLPKTDQGIAWRQPRTVAEV